MMKKSENVNSTQSPHVRKTISRQIKDQLNPLVQKLMNICSNVKVLTRQAEWEEIKRILELLKNIQEIESKYQILRSDRSNHWERFYAWCLENGAEFKSITIKEIKDGNYGVFAEEDIKEEEQFLVVPKTIMMTEVSAKNSKLGPLISSDPILQNMSNVQVAMHLLVESINPDSFWMPYISILPSSYNTILYFNFEELKELQGSPVLDEVFKIVRSVARQYCYFFQLFQKDTVATSLNIGPYFTYELYRWAVSSVMTRQNNVPSTNGMKSRSLIPLFDMCNHANGKITTDFNIESDSLISYSYRPFSKGDEVFMFYGSRTNGEFLVHNGFAYLDNENDGVEIKLGISKNDPLHSLKSTLCDKLNISVNGPFYVYLNEEIDKKFLIFLQITIMKSEELEKFLNDKNEREIVFENSDLMKRAYSFLKDRLFILLKSYKTTLEEDEELLKQDLPESVYQHSVILLRLSEKKILSNIYNHCLKRIEEL